MLATAPAIYSNANLTQYQAHLLGFLATYHLRHSSVAVSAASFVEQICLASAALSFLEDDIIHFCQLLL